MRQITNLLSRPVTCLSWLLLGGMLATPISAQTSYSYDNYTFGIDANGNAVRQAWTATSGSMTSNSYTHTYYAYDFLTGPNNTYGNNNGTNGGSSQSGPQTSVRHDTAITLNNLGTYTVTQRGYAYCSYVGPWPFYDSGYSTENINVDLGSAIQIFGLSNVVRSYTDNGDGTANLTLSTSDYEELYAAQFQCACGGGGSVLDNVIILRGVEITVQMSLAGLHLMQQLGIMNRERTPIRGEPNSTQTFPSPNGIGAGRTVRVYGPDGRAVRDVDYGDQSHSGYDPEVHHWD